MAKNNYPKHLSDPLRRTIAEIYVKHELRKLFPSLKDSGLWVKMDKDVGRWFSGSPTLAPLRDFWNGIHGISTGFKLKQIVPFVTSKNISWSKQSIPIEKLRFGTNFEELKQFPYRPSAQQVLDWYFDKQNSAAYKKALAAHNKRSSETAFRDNDPIIVMERSAVFTVNDGNRRLLNAILHGKKKINAFVGKVVTQPELYDFWLPTTLLIDFVRLHRLQPKSTTHVVSLLVPLLQLSTSGRHEFEHRAINVNEQSDKKLLAEVKKKIES